jgi:hypothetical protein
VDPTKLSEAVIRELSRHRSRNDIILDLCKASGMQWDAAVRFVHQIEINQHGTIVARQRPVLVLFAAAFILGGAAASIGMVAATLDGRVIFFLTLPVPYLGNIVYFALGVLAVIGGVVGLRRAMHETERQ